MTTNDWALSTLTIAAAALALYSLHRVRGRRTKQRRWDTAHYRATTRRWGAGPVGDGNWRTATGISIVIAGHGYALFRWPDEAFHLNQDRP